MYAKSTRPSAKCEVQKERSAKRDDQIARPRRAQTCERSELRAMRMCPQIFFVGFLQSFILRNTKKVTTKNEDERKKIKTFFRPNLVVFLYFEGSDSFEFLKF